MTSSGEGWIQLASMEANRTSSRHTSGALEAHEYVHLVQYAQFLGGPARTTLLPRWLLEGMATWSQAAVLGSTSYDAYAAERAHEIAGLRKSAQWIETFLAPVGTSWAPWNVYDSTTDSWRIYDIGLLATEVLVSLKGADEVMSLYADVARGESFDNSFRSRFGLAWSDAYPIIARVIARQIGT